MPAVEFVDAEAMVVRFLSGRLTVPVSTRVPNPRPVRFVRAWRTGGAALNRIVERAQFTVTCSAAGSVEAYADARAARSAFLNESAGMPLVRGVEDVSGVYFDPDPDTGGDRYSFTVRLTIRASR